ncbi:MFS transporter [Paralcaligenes sp. KSB-10]|uniref:MFS transporter n=1 Tax=Paralcaligenes sp. KSB-10 TaxID=2901142 RepID=UPI001E4B36B0|nr:MFS transporter [Paralcaligenes sp. KSB-10]UHL64938.1 MFS transporter [Paralcaligenes sp. KSB-10]
MSAPTATRPRGRHALTLSCLQALGGVNPAIVIALGGLAGQQLASRPDLATVPVSIYSLGLAFGTIPAALVMKRLGRRTGYLIGTLFGIAAGLVAAYGIFSQAFLIFCLGTLCSGLYAAYVQSYRFAAADAADPAYRTRAISWVMVGGLFGAIIAAQAIILTRNIWPAIPYAASFMAQASIALLAVPLVLSLRTPPTSVREEAVKGGRPLKEIARSPRFVIAVLAGVISYGLMNFIMTATPLAMIGCGHSLQDATLGIQWHILAMYGPSFFTGHIIERFGKIPVTTFGLILIGLAATVALAGVSVSHFWLALVLLGMGWNFGFIGATSMVTDCYRPEEKNRVQALNDFLVFGCVAVASFSSGHVLATQGWNSVNVLVYPFLAFVLLSLLWLWSHDRRARATA